MPEYLLLLAALLITAWMSFRAVQWSLHGVETAQAAYYLLPSP